jgi:hypothetical protein
MKSISEETRNLDKVQLALLLLLRRALTGSKDVPEKMTETEWIDLGNLAINCGVQAVAYDGLAGLPAESQPPREIKIKWAVNTAAIEDRNRKHKEVLLFLNDIMKAKKMRMLLLNGLGNASYYPIPEHRENSDIDIYTFDESIMVDKMISNRGIKVDAAPNFSSDFVLNGVLIENHHHFFNVRTSPLNRRFEAKMMELLETDKTRCKIFDAVSIPSPNEDIHLMSLRLMNKFAMGSCTLRHLCDWTTFLYRNEKNVDFLKFYLFLKDNGVYETASEITEICIRYLGLSDSFRVPSAPRNQAVENEMLIRMMNVKKRMHRTFSFKEKVEWLRSISWNYRIVHHDGSFWIVVLKTLLFS